MDEVRLHSKRAVMHAGCGKVVTFKYRKHKHGRTNTKSGSRDHEMSPNKKQKLPNNQVRLLAAATVTRSK